MKIPFVYNLLLCTVGNASIVGLVVCIRMFLDSVRTSVHVTVIYVTIQMNVDWADIAIKWESVDRAMSVKRMTVMKENV
jgi:hypothetical protein